MCYNRATTLKGVMIMKSKSLTRTALLGLLSLTLFLGSAQAYDLYWTTGLSGNVQAANFDGSGTSTLITFGVNMFGIGLLPTANKLYVAAPDRILYADLDGSNMNQFFVTGLSLGHGLAVDRVNSKIYFTSSTGISRIDVTTGTTVSTTLVTSSGGGSEALAVDPINQYIYFLNEGDASLRRVNYDGTGEISLVTGGNIFNPEGLALDTVNSRIYVVNQGTSSTGNIVEYDLNGNFIGTVVSGVATDGPEGVAISNNEGKLYFTASNSSGQIRRANLDGSSLENNFIGTLSTDVQQVAVIPEPSTYALIASALVLGIVLIARYRRQKQF